ncbi:MAG TPA: hypothetical protein PLB02_01815 [Thermoanaerobaculia bacterium]|nr:hypothetical protein [Thermoanaerobaculia bacterium]
MRGEFIGVWSETWREIWLPLIDEPLTDSDGGVPEDIFCELYREIAPALRESEPTTAIGLIVNDALLLREAFENAALRVNPNTERTSLDDAFAASGATEHGEEGERRAAAETALSGLIGEGAASGLAEVLAALAADPGRRAAAKERAIDRVINDPVRSREAFEMLGPNEIVGERALVGFLETAHEIAEELGGDELSNRYFNLLSAFIEKFSLRYDLRRPCILCPTLPGVFASLVRDLRVLASADPHLDALMKDFENAVRDLRQDCSDGRIKTCIQKQVNLLEAIGRTCPGVTEGELGRICGQITSWPHGAVKAALKNLYGFASDYPGIRHGGTAANALRAVDMRDMVAISILLAGFTPYLSSVLNPDVVYRGT